MINIKNHHLNDITISYSANSLKKGMNQTILPLAMGK